MSTLPKICLNMIVKDEAHILEKRLSSLCEKIITEGKETFISLGMWNKKNMPF